MGDDNEHLISYAKLEDINKIKCLKCGKLMSGLNLSNIKRHYQLIHKISSRIKRRRSRNKKTVEKLQENETNTTVSHEAIVEVDDGASPIPTTNLPLDKSEFLKCCIGMVTAGNIPLQIFDDNEHFKPIIAPYEREFAMNLNSLSMSALLQCSCAKLCEITSKKLHNKILSLKIDVALGNEKSVLLINVQYVESLKICMDTLGIIQYPERYNIKQLRQKIRECLALYNIDMMQIYTSTTDLISVNYVNGIKIESTLNEGQISQVLVGLTNTTTGSSDEQRQVTLASIMLVTRSTVQLIQTAAFEVLNEYRTQIEDCCSMVDKLRLAGEMKIKMPVLDNMACWLPTFEMLEALLDNKYTSIVLLEMEDEIDWEFICDFVAAFTPLVKFAKSLKNEQQYIIGDFYRDWLNCELELEDLNTLTPYAALLHESMQVKRKNLFFQSDAFLAAIYLDPRFNFINSFMLTEDHKKRAMVHLTKICKLLFKLEQEQMLRGSQSDISDTSNHSHSMEVSSVESPQPTTSKKAYAKLEQHIISLSQNALSTKDLQQTFRRRLTLLSNKEMVPLDTDILNYWQDNKLGIDIGRVAEIALAVPANQASGQRALNVLSMLSQSNENLSDSLLLTKLNLHEIKSKHVTLDFNDL